MRILGVNALALGKGEGTALHAHGLLGKAHEIHLDAALPLVVDGVMGEAGQVEIAVKLAIDADEQIEIEGGRDAAPVVIGGDENRDGLFEIDADEKGAAFTEQPRGIGKKGFRLGVTEIADGRA